MFVFFVIKISCIVSMTSSKRLLRIFIALGDHWFTISIPNGIQVLQTTGFCPTIQYVALFRFCRVAHRLPLHHRNKFGYDDMITRHRHLQTYILYYS